MMILKKLVVVVSGVLLLSTSVYGLDRPPLPTIERHPDDPAPTFIYTPLTPATLPDLHNLPLEPWRPSRGDQWLVCLQQSNDPSECQ